MVRLNFKPLKLIKESNGTLDDPSCFPKCLLCPLAVYWSLCSRTCSCHSYVKYSCKLMKQVLYAVRYDRLLPIVICDLSVSSNVKPLKASEHRSAGSEGQGFDSSWGTRNFFFVCVCLTLQNKVTKTTATKMKSICDWEIREAAIFWRGVFFFWRKKIYWKNKIILYSRSPGCTWFRFDHRATLRTID